MSVPGGHIIPFNDCKYIFSSLINTRIYQYKYKFKGINGTRGYQHGYISVPKPEDTERLQGFSCQIEFPAIN